MTQHQLDRAVAGATGESLSMIRSLGFALLDAVGRDGETEDLRLVLDCPFCGRAVPYPGLAGDGSAALAECDRCDVFFDFAPSEVYPQAFATGLRRRRPFP